jgi:AcrR family transcriptional regulator
MQAACGLLCHRYGEVMPKSRARKSVRNPDQTRERLLDAAEAEFNGPGFFDTDSNRIARAAGYAPQTFYRHFEDKTAIFLAVYDRWWRSEGAAIAETRAKGKASLADIADIVIAFHTRWRNFRRALRHLAIVDDRVRAARAEARLAQLASLPKRPGQTEAARAAALLRLERVSDAVAEGEFTDMGLTHAAAKAAVVEALRDTHGPSAR